MEPLSRRALLAAGAASLATLAGCTTTTSGGDGGQSDGGATAGEATTTVPGLSVDTLDVGGSTGERLPVQPPDRVVLLDFFATWCAPCKPQMAELRQVRESFPDAHMLSITWESEAAKVRDFWREYDGTWPVAMDPEVRTGEEYGVSRLPTMIVLAPDGTEVWRHVGLAAADTVSEKLREAQA